MEQIGTLIQAVNGTDGLWYVGYIHIDFALKILVSPVLDKKWMYGA
jgi:hypothetical protein